MERFNETESLVKLVYEKGIEEGRKRMEEKMMYTSKTGQPIEINGRAWFVKSDMQNLRGIFANMKSESDHVLADLSLNGQTEEIKQILNDCAMDLLTTDRSRMEISDRLLRMLEKLDQ